MWPQCLACGHGFTRDGIAWDRDQADCHRCGQTYRLSELYGRPPLPTANLAQPPAGCSLVRSGDGFIAKASTRSAIGLWLVPLTITLIAIAFWLLYHRSFVGLFVLAAPAQTIGPALLAVAGRLVIGKQGDQGWLFIGCGPLGWTRRFAWSQVKAAATEEGYFGRRQPYPKLTVALRLRDGRTLRAGSTLTPERRAFLVLAAQTAASAPPKAAPGPPAVRHSPAESGPKSPPALP